MASIFSDSFSQTTHKKKTRQGAGRSTKWGNKSSKKHYIKRYRGQGGPKRRKNS